MESTGVYWKPIYNILEATDIEILVVNAQHIKAVPGGKTDVKDAEWIADLLRHGLLRGSYIPNRDQRELRELIRYRTKLTQERSGEVNRIQKVLEGANIKLGDVASDVMGKSGQDILRAIISVTQKLSQEIKRTGCALLSKPSKRWMAFPVYLELTRNRFPAKLASI